jgi:hypothetical protein
MARGTAGMPGWESGPRWPARTHPAPASFVAELRRARLQAGEPSYREIARRTERMYSPATIWRAFTQEKLPHWRLTAAILKALEVDNLDTWREMWFSARSEERAHGSDRDAQQAVPADPARGISAESPRRLAALTAPQAEDPSQPGSQVCDDCGAVIGDLICHQAWHWRIERQLSRASLRAIEGTGQ